MKGDWGLCSSVALECYLKDKQPPECAEPLFCRNNAGPGPQAQEQDGKKEDTARKKVNYCMLQKR